MEIRKLMEEMKDVLFILLVTAFFTWIANCIQLPKVNMAESSIGVLLLVVITAFGILVSHLPGFRILPMVFWVSIIAVVISLPGFPGGDWVIHYTKQVGFLPITTPVLAYCGLSLGKDIDAFPGALFRWRWPSVRAASSAQLCSLKSFCILKASSDALRQLYSPAQVRTVQVHWAGAEFVIDR